MKEQVQKTFEALFALEDIREVLRQTLPTGPDHGEEQAIREGVARVRAILDDLEAGTGSPKVTKIAGSLDIRNREESYINVQPIQAAGRLTLEARKALIAYGDGYSTCDACRKPFRLDKI
ncbi:MAG TPA: O-phospho-L-seryl-tRNA:Cys-tRNA synthase, partial [Methanoculleus sp.]|nr:O-phospho-L-seryl-tRNA:Cys-tRNA synthase [Methanoculleus sp.]